MWPMGLLFQRGGGDEETKGIEVKIFWGKILFCHIINMYQHKKPTNT